jgi:hypothetical protein
MAARAHQREPAESVAVWRIAEKNVTQKNHACEQIFAPYGVISGAFGVCAQPPVAWLAKRLIVTLKSPISFSMPQSRLLYHFGNRCYGLGLPQLVGARHTQTGRFGLEAINTEIFFVTLDKSEKTFSPWTRYEDFAVSPTRFYWQSQSTTGENSPTDQRYVHQSDNKARFLLFVRPRPGAPFLFLGPLRYVSHSGSRPMSIYWDLEHPMPAWFFEICASLRAA